MSAAPFTPSPQQDSAMRAVARWMRVPARSSQVFRLFGFAGTGKTELAKRLVADSDKRWLFGAFTGKAAHVLRQRGCQARTLHSMIYRFGGVTAGAEIARLETELALLRGKLAEEGREAPWEHEVRAERSLLRRIEEARRDSQPAFTLASEESDLADPDVGGIVVDEVSMVDEDLGRDLESFGKKILVLGDPFQLPPVFGGGYFTDCEPNVLLTEVHRHAADSGVLRLATAIRQSPGAAMRSLASQFSMRGTCDDVRIMMRASADKDEIALEAMSVGQVLVGRNATRHATGARHRELLGRRSPLPERGERLMCLRNVRGEPLLNGSQWIVTSDGVLGAHESRDDLLADMLEDEGVTSSGQTPGSDDSIGWLSLKSEDDPAQTWEGNVWLHHFLRDAASGRDEESLRRLGPGRLQYPELGYGDVVTVHKSQGSQWSSVMLIDESRAMRGIDPRRWLYTGVTRARERVVVVA